jgi:N-acetylglucosaminyldiphosphoundecaprenol N-acetyl-beta-D-mannosaminyltransferase
MDQRMAYLRRQFRRVSLLGAEVDLVRRHQVVAFVAHAVLERRKAIVANHNLHSIYFCGKDARMTAFFSKADLIEIDSMPLVYWARLLGLPTTQSNRCTYLDWRDSFWAAASAGGWRVYCLGGRPGVGEEAVRRLRLEWPGVTFATHHGYFDQASGSAENRAVLDDINAFGPDIILVGMGMPIQETWVGENFDEISTGVALTVGAAIDYEAGAQPPAPRFLGGLCLEWLYRLVRDPRRLAGRYLVEPWTLMPRALDDLASKLAPGNRLRGKPFASDADLSAAADGDDTRSDLAAEDQLSRAA